MVTPKSSQVRSRNITGKLFLRRTGKVRNLIVLVFLSQSEIVNAALVSPCSQVSLPPSVVTDIVGQAVLPVTGILDGVPLLSLLGLSTNLTNSLAPIAAGAPIQLNVLDTNGNVVSPGTECDVIADDVIANTVTADTVNADTVNASTVNASTVNAGTVSADSYQMNSPKGVSIGGNQITGLGDSGRPASAGEINSIAIGNNATTDAQATNSIALGTDSSVGSGGADSVAIGHNSSASHANSVALGSGSTTTTGAQSNYNAYALSQPQTSAGEVSIGSLQFERKLTNVAAGSAPTDAVNVQQLDAAIKQTYTNIDNRFNSLKSDINAVRHDANAGTASAMALASMPQSATPGKVLIAAGVANYEGESAASIGVSNFSENGKWIVNLNGSANSRGNAGAAVGVGFHW